MTGHLDLNSPILELELDAPLLPADGSEQDFPVIHGRSRGGFELTLLGVSSIRDWPMATWFAVDDALVGGHLDLADAAFAETTVVMDHLTEWVPARGIRLGGSRYGEPGKNELELTYPGQTPLEGRLPDGTDVMVRCSVLHGWSLKAGHTVKYGANIRWQFRKALSTAEIVARHVVPLQELVAWGVQQPVTVTAAYLRVQTDQKPLEWRRRWRKASAADSDSRVGNSRLFGSDLAPTFAEGLTRWLDVLKKNRDSIDLMVSLLYGAPQYLDTTLQLVAQSLEAYHRSAFEKELWPAKVFRERRRAVRARFNEEEDRDLKKWLAEVLMFANEPSLAERLHDLQEKVEPVLDDLLALRPDWADDIKNMRNRYTHRGQPRRGFGREEPREMERFGRIVFDVCLLLDLGLSIDTCRDRVRQWSDYSWAMHDARKHHPPSQQSY